MLKDNEKDLEVIEKLRKQNAELEYLLYKTKAQISFWQLALDQYLEDHEKTINDTDVPLALMDIMGVWCATIRKQLEGDVKTGVAS